MPSSPEPLPDPRAAAPDPADAAARPAPGGHSPGDGTPDWALDDNPSLRAHVGAQWRRLPPAVRRVVTVAVLGAVGLAGWRGWTHRAAPAGAETQEQQARAEWAAILRQSPETLGADVATGTLGPGDAQAADGRYEDYHRHVRRDSAAFSIVVTSADFAPDVAVRRPDGQTVAASNLLRTGSRAEVSGLVGPGRFEITVSSRSPRGEGAYELAVVPLAALDSLYAGDPPRADTLGRGTRRAGRYERLYGVVGAAETPVVIRVVSAAFTPRLSLLGPSGEVVAGAATVERRTLGDSLAGVLLRYVPGWDAPYRLTVSSEEPGATGPFALEVLPVETRELRPDEGGVTRRLGDESWLVRTRYVDYFRFTARAGTRTLIEATSPEVPPALRLWRPADRQPPRRVAAALNPGGAGQARIEQALEPGEYLLEVTTGGADTLAALGGEYRLVLRSELLEPPPPRPGAADGAPSGPRPPTRTFGVGVSRTGQSGSSTFDVAVTQVSVSYPAGRTRVQLSVSVRSVDYTGNWAPWASFVSKGYVVDDQGRRYAPSGSESRSPSGPAAEPGTVRRGTVVFYAPGVHTGQARFVYVASLGDGSVTLPIAVP